MKLLESAAGGGGETSLGSLDNGRHDRADRRPRVRFRDGADPGTDPDPAAFMTRPRRPFAAPILVTLLGAFAPPASAQMARVEKAHLDLESAPTSVAAGSVARRVARVAIDDGWHVNASVPTLPYLIPTELTVELPAGWPAATIEYPPSVRRRFAFADQALDVYEGVIQIPFLVQIPAGSPAGRVDATVKLRYQSCSDRVCLAPVTTSVPWRFEVAASSPATTSTVPATKPPPPAPSRGLLVFLLIGWVGGLILNAMPCVLPILSLKVFGIVQSASRGRRVLTVATLSTAAGILASFLGLAVAAIVARGAGSSVGWGVQFQEPRFVAFLAIAVLLFSLNLWGLFEIQLPAFLRRRIDRTAASGAANGAERASGHFVSGLFATLMATPCSAPFLGTAVGFALTQPPTTVLAMFLAIGLGMASPYLLLAAFPRLAKRFPRPGEWMETLKGAMGFLLAGAVVWLFFVLSAQISAERLAFFQMAALAVALLLWLATRLRREAAQSLLRLLALALAIVSVPLVGRGGAAAAASSHRPAETATAGIVWQPWRPGEPERLAAQGKTVFVDVTADWCFTCKVNERIVLNSAPVTAAFASGDTVALKADWTNPSQEIADYLASFGRYGIPFYAVYRPGAPPRPLPEILTQSIVLEAIGATQGGGR
jgi:thiol:disulfide interchange protein